MILPVKCETSYLPSIQPPNLIPSSVSYHPVSNTPHSALISQQSNHIVRPLVRLQDLFHNTPSLSEEPGQ